MNEPRKPIVLVLAESYVYFKMWARGLDGVVKVNISNASVETRDTIFKYISEPDAMRGYDRYTTKIIRMGPTDNRDYWDGVQRILEDRPLEYWIGK